MDEESRRQAKIEEETSYELMLKQQQLFLQWQLEMQSKVSRMILLFKDPEKLRGVKHGSGLLYVTRIM